MSEPRQYYATEGKFVVIVGTDYHLVKWAQQTFVPGETIATCKTKAAADRVADALNRLRQ